jgi:hypothetical protein
MRRIMPIMLGLVWLTGCAATQQQEAADLTAAFNVAAAAEVAYAASPLANPQNVAQAARLLAAAQAALLTWSNSTAPADQTAANAAVAALVAYEASLPGGSASAGH